MRVRIDKAALMAPLTRAANAADQKAGVNNVIGCIHLIAEDERSTLALHATDYAIDLYTTVNADVQEAGEMVVNAKSMLQVISGLPNGSVVELSCPANTKNHRLRIDAGKSCYHVNGLDPAEFPLFDDVSGNKFIMDKQHIIALLKRTLFSVSNDDSRPAITGVLLKIERIGPDDEHVSLVSTDGHRLSLAQRKAGVKDFDGVTQQHIIHRRGATELLRLLDGADPTISIWVSGRQMVFESDNAKLKIRPIEATFPDYGKVLPTPERTVSINKIAFVSAIKRVMSLGSIDMIKVTLTEAGMSLDATFPDIGDSHEELEIEGWHGQLLKLGFNPKYVLDACNAMTVETIKLGVTDQMSPSLLHSDEDPGSRFVVMPVRL
jgi:DNA polymerase-3 subunit beta